MGSINIFVNSMILVLNQMASNLWLKLKAFPVFVNSSKRNQENHL